MRRLIHTVHLPRPPHQHPTCSCGTCPARAPSLAPISVPPTIYARITTRRLRYYRGRSSAHVPTAESSHLRCHTPPPALAQQFAHAHAPTLPSLHETGLELQVFFLYRARVARAVARPQEQYRFSVSQPCKHARSFFLVLDFCSSLAGTLFSSFRRTHRRRASTHMRTRCARANDRRRTTRRAVRRRG